METIANAIVSLFELVEAEGRTLKQRTVIVLEAFILMFFGASLLFFGVVAAGAALYMWLSSLIGRPGAAVVVAVSLVALGLITLFSGRKYSRGGGGPAE